MNFLAWCGVLALVASLVASGLLICICALGAELERERWEGRK